jgi:hypothetical protein
VDGFIYLLFVHSNSNRVCFKMVLYLLLAFPGIGFQTNTIFSTLPGQTDSIEFLGNFQTTLFAKQVLHASIQTGPRRGGVEAALKPEDAWIRVESDYFPIRMHSGFIAISFRARSFRPRSVCRE